MASSFSPSMNASGVNGGSHQKNLKVTIRIKAVDYQSKMLEFPSEKQVTIKDLYNKSKMEKQTFAFDQIYTERDQNGDVYKTVQEHCVNKVIDNINAAVIVLGQTGTGKTYTLFGDPSIVFSGPILTFEGPSEQKGIIYRTMEGLFKKAEDFEEYREFVISCSFYDIHMDNIRDLLRGFALPTQDDYMKNPRDAAAKTFQRSLNALDNQIEENEPSLEVYENSNGQIMIKNITTPQIRSLADFHALVHYGFMMKQRLVELELTHPSRSHLIFSINILQRDKENYNFPAFNSSIQFAEIAGAEKIVKSFPDKKAFQQGILLNANLVAIQKMLLAISSGVKNIPYKESKLTRVLQNCCGPSSQILTISGINPNETNFEESLNTLALTDRFKNIDLKTKTYVDSSKASSGQIMSQSAAFNPNMLGNQEKVIKKLQDENAELKSRIDYMQKDYKNKFIELGQRIGINDDLEKLVFKPNAPRNSLYFAFG